MSNPKSWGAVPVETPADWGAVAVAEPEPIAIEPGLTYTPATSPEELYARNFYRRPITIAAKSTGEAPTVFELTKEFWGDVTTPIPAVAKWIQAVPAKTLSEAVDVIRSDIWEAAKHPFSTQQEHDARVQARLAETSREPSGVEKVIAGTQQTVAETVQSFASPLGIATLGLGALPKLAQRIVAGGFAAHMASTLPEQAKAAVEAIKAGDAEAAAKHISGTALTTAFVGLAGKHALAAEKAPAVIDIGEIKVEAAKAVGPATESVVARETILEAPKGELETPTAEPIGLGAATPAEFELGQKNQTSLRNAVVDRERSERGLPPAMEVASRDFGTVWETAMERIDADPNFTDWLLVSLKEKPRAVTDIENATLLHRQIELQNEYTKAMRDLAQATDDARLEDVELESVRVAGLSDRLLNLYEVGKAAGTETARGLNARKMLAFEDFSLAKMELEKRAAKGGEKLTDAERAGVVESNKLIEAAEKAFDEYTAGTEDRIRTSETARVIKEVVKSKDPVEPIAEITEQMREKFAAGESDAFTSLAQKLARQFVARGIKEREPLIEAVHNVIKDIDPTLTLRDTMDAISGYGRFRRLSEDDISVKLRDLKGQMQQVAKLEDIQQRQPPLKTGVERRIPTDEERRLIKMVNEAKRRFGIVVTDPATQLKSSLEARKTFYRNQISDLEAQIAAKEKFVKEKSASPTDAELEGLRARSTELREEFDAIFGKPGLSDAQRLEAMNKRVAELEARIASGDVATKPAPVSRPLSPELEQSKQQLESLNRTLAELRKKPDSVKAAEQVAKQIETLNKRISEKEAKIAAGDLSAKASRVSRPQQPGIEIAKQRLDALNKQIAELREAAKPKLTEEQAALKALKQRLQRSITTFEDKLARGDFSKKQPRTVALDAEANRLHFKAAKAKANWHEALMRDRLARRSLPAKLVGGLGEMANTVRAIITSGEFSGVLRQGGVISIGNPARAAKAFPAMIKGLRSEAGQHAVDLEIMSRDNYPVYLRAKLYLAEHGQKLSQMEEAYMSRWAGKIPVVAGTQRAYSTFLNKLRADSFDALAATLVRRTGELTPERARDIASYVNVATGRGSFGVKHDAALVFLNTTFFAPRWVASRFQLLLGQPLWRPIARRDWAMTRLIGEEYGKFLIGMAVIYGLSQMAGAEVEWDSRSSDFGKLRFGETRVDLMAGLQQQTVLLSRLYSGENKRLSGKVVPIRGSDIPFGSPNTASVAGRFLRTKLAPIPGAALDVATGQDVVNQPVTLSSELLEMSVPLTYRDIYKALVEQGVPSGTALALLAIFGAGVQTYESR